MENDAASVELELQDESGGEFALILKFAFYLQQSA
jgi:hypothetical protein